MTDRSPYRPVDTRIWDGTRDEHLADWLGDHFAHWDGDQLVVRTPDGETRPGPGWTLRLMPDGQLMVSSPHAARRLGYLYDRLDTAETTSDRVTSLYERWVKAGPPPLGTSMARSWDMRLAELRDAIQPKEQ